MKKYANYFLYMFITFILICVTSCGSGAGGTSNTDSNIDSGQLQMSSLVYLPKSGTNSATTLIYNGTNTSLVLSTATANGQSIYPSNTTSSIPPTNVTSCANVLQNDYCKITINNNENTQNLALSFVFVDKNGKKYTTTQNVIYTDTSYLSGDFYLIGQSNNSIDVMKTPQGLKMSALTFELNSNYESNSLNVSSSNHSVTVTSPLCSGYTKGSLCTVNFNLDSTINDNTSIPIIISGTVQNTSTSFMNKLQQSLIKLTDIEPTATLNVNVNNIPNLIASPTNVVISPANGSPANAQSVMLVNNGTANAVLGTILSATPVITTLNTCTPNTILTANGGSCTFSLNANSTISGNTNTLIPYTDSQGTQYPNIMLNVTYITATPGPNQSITLGSSSTLTNTVIGTTSILPVTITNTGTVTLESITFYPSSQPSSIIYDPISSCKTNGTQSLVAGNSCTLILDYTPTSTENGVMLLSTMASYGSGQSLPTGPVSINYSSESGVAVLNITPNSTSLAIKADGVDTKTQVFTIINNGQIATTITAESIPVGLVKGADTCLNQTIAVGGSCTISTSFGPTRSTVNSTTNLTVTYLPIVGMAPVNAYSAVSLAATTSALIQITNVTESGIFTGSGNTFTFTNSPLTPFVINITYTNNGTSVANLFTIFGPLPYGWYVQSTPATTCQFNQGVTLSAGSSCILSLAAMDPTVTIYGISPYSYAGALNVNIPGFSYNDTSGTTRVANPSYTFGNTINVTSRLFANVSESSTTTSGSGSSAHVIAAKFTLAGSVPAGHFPITITTDIPTNGAINSAIPYCTIVSAGGDCTVTINTVAGAPTTTYTRSYTVSPNGSANGITGKFTFVVQ